MKNFLQVDNKGKPLNEEEAQKWASYLDEIIRKANHGNDASKSERISAPVFNDSASGDTPL